MSKFKYPSIKDISEIVKCLKKYIDDDCIQEDDDLPSIDLTIGYSIDGSWDYQSGDIVIPVMHTGINIGV